MKWSIKSFDQLTVNELYEICKARYEVFVCEQNIFQENDFDDIDKLAVHLFLQEKDKVIAYARIIPKDISYNEVSIGRVLVLKEYRRRGLAAKLIDKAVEFSKNEMKCKRIVLSAQLYIKDLYKNAGFKEVSDIYDEVGIPHIKMILE